MAKTKGKQMMKKQRRVERGYGGKQYVFRGESADESEDDDMEAGHDDIMEEELISGMIASKEDEREAQLRRQARKKSKWKKLKRLNPDAKLDDVSSEDSEEDEY